MRLIGHRWKYGNVCRLVILIGRGLDLKNSSRLRLEVSWSTRCRAQIHDLTVGSREATFKPKGFETVPVQFSRCENQRQAKASQRQSHTISGDYSLRVPPVPIPNTEVKPQHADSTWLETAREGRSSPDSNKAHS